MTYDEIMQSDALKDWNLEICPPCISYNREEQYRFELKRWILEQMPTSGIVRKSYLYMDENGKWRIDETRYNMEFNTETKTAVYYRSPRMTESN